MKIVDEIMAENEIDLEKSLESVANLRCYEFELPRDKIADLEQQVANLEQDKTEQERETTELQRELDAEKSKVTDLQSNLAAKQADYDTAAKGNIILGGAFIVILLIAGGALVARKKKKKNS
jgi:LPXTG-motif cell wall-anchored protein